MKKKTDQELKEIESIINSIDPKDIRLLFVTRHVKEDIPPSRKTLDKHYFKAWRIDLLPELQTYFLELLKQQKERTFNSPNLQVDEYSVISDDLGDRIYTYALNNAQAFEELVNNQMQKGLDIPYVKSLKDINEALWAYSIIIEDKNNKQLMSFRRITKSKIAIEEEGLKHQLLCLFDTDDSKLRILDGESIKFDNKVDCLFYEGRFFVFHKSSFEGLLGMEEEFKQNAEMMIQELKKTNYFSGLEILEDEISRNHPLLKKLAQISRNDGYKNISKSRIQSMQKVAKRFHEDLKVISGKIVIEDKKDVDVLVKMLAKYYVECMQTHEPFGSFAKISLAQIGQNN